MSSGFPDMSSLESVFDDLSEMTLAAVGYAGTW